jgi:2-oxoglutarate dehydrogenase E1 component
MPNAHWLSFFSHNNVEYIDRLYEQFRQDPESVPEPWFGFFCGLEAAPEKVVSAVVATTPAAAAAPTPSGPNLREAFQRYGARIADLHPFQPPATMVPELEPRRFGLASADDPAWRALRALYAGTLAAEFLHLETEEERLWFAEAFETATTRRALDAEAARRAYQSLFAAEALEQFLHTRFIGQKRFSLEGGEAMIPLLETVLDEAGTGGVVEGVLGMAHRGRLNVLVHLMGKPYEKLFAEFLGLGAKDADRDGDVKYHLGAETTFRTARGADIALTLCPNPSHLEVVNPVVEGFAAARQNRLGGGALARRSVLPILIHGEAAFTGQGVVFETLTLTRLAAAYTGGTIHVIVNNQIGFTAEGHETRFSPYPTEVAKMIGSPVLHVNALDVEATLAAARLAVQYRQKFGKDVFIHFSCYRKYGHNEGDDPTFTQPVAYKHLENFPSVVARFRAALLATGRADEATLSVDERRTLEALERALESARSGKNKPEDKTAKAATRIPMVRKTSARLEHVRAVGDAVVRYPPDFTVNPKVGRVMAQRQQMTRGERPIDWGCGEALAFGSLLAEGVSIRLHGQDCERGTFSHRHAVLRDQNDGHRFVPLRALAQNGAEFDVFNSMLSEFAVLGFEYGWTLADRERLVLWEAQFGDFANGAQVILDQYVSSGETKWGLQSRLTLLLPHGYEGQGPEHSSGRLERFLELSARDNWRVAQPTTPAQYFHLLRDQAFLPTPRPLIVMTPKSLLRLPQATSTVQDITGGKFEPVLVDAEATRGRGAVDRVLFCTGRVFYALEGARKTRVAHHTAIVRLEQLYPFPEEEIAQALHTFASARDFAWVQDEPENMGAWRFVAPLLRKLLPRGASLRACTRPESPSPATGYLKHHEEQEAALIAAAFSGDAERPEKQHSRVEMA